MQFRTLFLLCISFLILNLSNQTTASQNAQAPAQADSSAVLSSVVLTKGEASAQADVKASIERAQCIECKRKPSEFGQGRILYTKCCAKMMCLPCVTAKKHSQKNSCPHCDKPLEATSHRPVMIPQQQNAVAQGSDAKTQVEGSASSDRKEAAEEMKCVVCYNPQKHLTYTQCCGQILCVDCYASIIETVGLQKRCPHCRKYSYSIRTSKPKKRIPGNANAAAMPAPMEERREEIQGVLDIEEQIQIEGIVRENAHPFILQEQIRFVRRHSVTSDGLTIDVLRIEPTGYVNDLRRSYIIKTDLYHAFIEYDSTIFQYRAHEIHAIQQRIEHFKRFAQKEKKILHLDNLVRGSIMAIVGIAALTYWFWPKKQSK